MAIQRICFPAVFITAVKNSPQTIYVNASLILILPTYTVLSTIICVCLGFDAALSISCNHCFVFFILVKLTVEILLSAA